MVINETSFSRLRPCGRPIEKEYWAVRTPAERLEALEVMRRIAYGYDPEMDRIQRLLEIVPLLDG